MNRQALWAVLLLVGAVVIAGAMVMLRPQPEEVDVVATVPLVETAPYEVNSGALEILGNGTVSPREEVSLGAQISGRLVYVNPSFREGGTVGRGDVLFRVDASDYNNQVRSAQADVAAQDVAVMQAQEEVAIAQAELTRFANRQSTGGAGTASAILPPEELQTQPGTQPQSAQVTGPNILATREPQLRSAQAARDRAQAQLADARLALSRTAVRAPFSGLVRSEDASVGTLVQPGQALGSIVARDVFEARVSLTEAEAALIPGLFDAASGNIPASVEMDYGGHTWRWAATVDRADPILDPATRTIDVFLRVNNPMGGGVLVGQGEGLRAPPLLLGSFVRASISGGASQPYATIPLDAVREGNTVWLLAQGKLRIVPVEVIQRTDELAFVAAEALGEGGHVITSGLRTPVEGMDLRSQAAPPEPEPEPALEDEAAVEEDTAGE